MIDLEDGGEEQTTERMKASTPGPKNYEKTIALSTMKTVKGNIMPAALGGKTLSTGKTAPEIGQKVSPDKYADRPTALDIKFGLSRKTQ